MALVKQEPTTCNDNAIIKQEQADAQPQQISPSSCDGDHPIQSVAPIEDSNERDNELADSKPLGPEDSCDLNPEFAVICSFIIQFGDKIDLELDLENLKRAIEDQSNLDEELINIHVKLLKKFRRYFVRDQWEKALIRFASEYSYEHAYEIESYGYQKTRPSVKLELLRRLLDVQFQCDQKFKAAVNLCEANELRVPPLGRDIKGNTYWKKDDKDGHFRIYREEPLDYKTWNSVCSNATELQTLINELDQTQNDKVKGEPMSEPYNPLPEIFPEYFEVEEEEEPEQRRIEDKKVSRVRKSRQKGRRKTTPISLPTLEEEENSIQGKESNINEITGPSANQQVDIKPQIKCEKYKPENTAVNHEDAISSANSTESQVKSTLENIISRVVASIEYIIRPLSRTSNEDSPIVQDVKPQRQKKTAPRQRKRERVQEEVLPRRSSSRIQQIQQKKQVEQEEELKKMIEREQKRAQQEAISQDEDSRSRTSIKNGNKKQEKASNGKRRKKADWRKGKKRLSWDKDDSDLSSISSATESEEDDFDDTQDFSIDTNNLDDEFACEDEDTNIEPVIIRRARTARQSVATNETGDLNETTIIEEDKPCGRCDKSNDPEWILLCDMCDCGYHTSCTLPPLMVIPDGDWYCPSCEHKTLLTKLKEFHQSVSLVLAAKAEEEKKKRQQAARRKPAIKSEPAPILQESTNGRRAKDILSELNEPIALQRLDECLGTDSESTSTVRSRNRAKRKRGTKKPMSRNRNSNPKRSRKANSRDYESESEEVDSYDEIAQVPSEDELPKQRRARASVSYKFKEYDALIKSAIRGESEEEEEEPSTEGEEPAANYGRGKDMATIEALAYQQENGLAQEQPVAQPKSTKSRRKGRRLNDLDAISEAEDVTSDESFQASATEAEDAELTEEALSEDTETSIDEILGSVYKKRKKLVARRHSYESDDSDYQPNRSKRRAATKRTNYAESSADDEEGSVFGEKTKKAKKTILSSDEETEASWKSDPTPSNEDEDEEPPSPFDEDVDEADITDGCEDGDDDELPAAGSEPSQQPGSEGEDESIDEIVAPLFENAKQKKVAQTAAAKVVSNKNAKQPDPMNQLDQYCLAQAGESTMYNSYTQILSNQSPPHPPFYGDDDPKQGANDKRYQLLDTTRNL